MNRDRLNKLLLDCLAGGNPPGGGQGPSAAEWAALSGEALKHQVAPLLYRHLLEGGTDVPSAVLNDLKNSYHRQAILNTHIYREFSKVLAELRQRGIEVIVLKGAHLAELVYGNIALRPMGDVDILIRKDDLAAAEEGLLALGYDPPEHPRHRQRHKTRFSRINFEKPGGIAVEVHWILDRPGSPFSIDTAGLWARSRPADIAGTGARVLSPEDLLLHMCWQASANKMFARGLLTLCDIRRIVSRHKQEMDWGNLLKRVRQWGFDHIAYITLCFAADLLRAEVPEAFLRALRPAELDRNLVAYARDRTLDASGLSEDVLRLGSKGTLRNKLSLLFSRVFLSRETLALRYGVAADSWRIWPCYPVHFRYLLRQYGLSLWRLLLRNREMVARVEGLDLKDDLRRWLGRVPGQGSGHKPESTHRDR